MRELDLAADLFLELTTADGDTATARVHGSGSHVAVEVDRPQAMFDAVGRADLARLADLLASYGVTATVMGRGGQLARLGAGTRSRFGRLVIGSYRVEPTRAAPWIGILGPQVGRVMASAIRRRLHR